MTKKENFVAINAVLNEMGHTEFDEFIAHEIELLERKNAKAKERAAKKPNAATDELAAMVNECVEADWATIADITAKVVDRMPEGAEVSESKVRYRLNALAKEGIVQKSEATVVDEGGKKRKCVVYALAE